jgi:hypothetical protein
MSSQLGRVAEPWAAGILPRWMFAAPHEFLYRFVDSVHDRHSALHSVLCFSVFVDAHGLGVPVHTTERVACFKSIPWPDSPTHMVHVQLLPGIYFWVAHIWPRLEGPDYSPYPGLRGRIIGCGSLSVRRCDRKLKTLGGSP